MQYLLERSSFRDALERTFSRFQRTSETTFDGEVHPTAPLVGPPGRLHGGLHPMVRLVEPSILAGLPRETPLRLDLGLRAGIPLDATTAFDGELTRSGDDFDLVTRFGGDDRLVARASSRLGGFDLAEAHDEYRACTREPEVRNILARGTIPTRVGRKTVSLSMDSSFFAVPDNAMDGYRMRDGGFDEAFAGVALDLIGAVAVAIVHRTHLFTTHLEFDVHRRTIPRETTLVATASIVRAHPDPNSSVKPVEVRGELVPPTRVPVLLTDADFDELFVTGFVTVVPVRGGLVEG